MTILVTKRWLAWRYGFDNGVFQHSMNMLARGDLAGIRNGGHWSPVLLLLVPPFRLWPSGLTLQLAQVALLGAAVVPAYALARRYLARGAGGFAALLLFYPPVLAYAYNDMHEAAFFPVLVWSTLWALDRERYALFALFGFAAANVREDASFGVAIFGFALGFIALRARTGTAKESGILYGCFRRPRAVALGGFVLGSASFLIAAAYLTLYDPYRAGGTHLGGIYTYPFSNAGPFALLHALAADPRRIAAVFSLEKALYVPKLLLPLAALPLVSPWSLLALPQLAIVLLSSNRDVWTPELQYVALSSPWLQLGVLDALRRFAARAPNVARNWQRAAIACTVLVLLLANPMHIGRYQKPAYAREDAARAVALVPVSDSVALPIPWYAALAAARLNSVPYFCDDVPWAVYADDDPEPLVRSVVARLEREIASGVTTRAARFGHVSVFRRSSRPKDARCTAEF